MFFHKKRALIILPHDKFQDEEYTGVVDVLHKAGIKTWVASSTSATYATGLHGKQVTVNLLLSDVDVDDYDAIIYIGGPGAMAYWHDTYCIRIAKEAFKKGKVIGAICIAPMILAHANILDGKKATIHPSEEKKLRIFNIEYTANPVEVDGKIITADGPGSATAFAQAIVSVLKSKSS